MYEKNFSDHLIGQAGMGSTRLLCVLTLSPYRQAIEHHVEGKETAMKHKPLYGTLAGLCYGMLPAQSVAGTQLGTCTGWDWEGSFCCS